MGKIILFISAFVPMFIVFLVTVIFEIINQNMRLNITNSLVLIVLSLLILIGVIGLIVIINCKNKNYTTIKLISKKNITDQHFLNYFSLFVLLALTFDFSKISYLIALIIILIFIAIVYIKNNIYYVNPLLNLLGYSFYDIVYEEKSERKELRIFFKGELKVSGKAYRLYSTSKNLNFMVEEKSKRG